MASNAEKGYQQDDLPPPYNENTESTNVDLPTYNQTSSNTAEPPPSYESLFGRMKQAKQESSGQFDFMKKCFKLIIGPVGWTILIGASVTYPTLMIVMGSLSINQCPAERFIPIYLIVMGCLCLIRSVAGFRQEAKASSDGEENEEEENEEEGGNKMRSIFGHIISTFIVAWFIAGNVWIYRLYGHYDGSDSAKSNYCSNSLYLYAFWMINIWYILLMTVCCCTCYVTLIANYITS